MWQSFQEDMNRFGQLRWEFSQRQRSINFLDMTIFLSDDGTVSTTLFEKCLNLYLYLPPQSCHAPGVLWSLIYGMLHRINRLTSDKSARRQQIETFYHRLRACGYTKSMLGPVFTQAQQHYRQWSDPPQLQHKPHQSKCIATNNTIFLHLPFHPSDPSSRKIQHCFHRTLLNPLGKIPLSYLRNHKEARIDIDRMIVAYH